MKIVADENIPYAQMLFSSLGDVSLRPGRHMSPQDLDGADVLLTRSVTKVNETLLANVSVQFVGTCTIGTDHIDKNYLHHRNITFASAPGCNAHGVVQYDICALAYLGRLKASLKYAVVGCGNVGGRVYRTLKALGYDCIGVDPHLDVDQIPDLKPFEAIYDCDVICMHTPRISSGPYPTESMIGTAELEKLKKGATLLNAGRGECIDNEALLRYLKKHSDLQVVLDVWANEPHMNAELHACVDIGTPHIAGYSFEGRVNGSTMIFEALARYLGKNASWIDEQLTQLRQKVFGAPEMLGERTLAALVSATYDIERDHRQLAVALAELPSAFDRLRKSYHKRREFGHYRNLDPVLEQDTGVDVSQALAMVDA